MSQQNGSGDADHVVMPEPEGSSEACFRCERATGDVRLRGGRMTCEACNDDLLELVEGDGLTSHTSLSSQSRDSAWLSSFTSSTSLPSWPELPSEALYGLAGDFVATVDPHTEADAAALLVQFLTAFGCTVGRGPGFRAEADHHGTNLFAVIVADSAKGRKGTSWGYVRRLFMLVDPTFGDRLKAGLATGEGLISEVRDEITRHVPVVVKGKPTGEYTEQVIDPGVTDKRLLVHESEFAQPLKVLQREGNTLSPLVREAWDGRTLRTMTKTSPVRATDPHIAIIGHITGEELCRLLSASELANGFANRFLIVCARRSKVLPDGGALSDSLLSRLALAVNRAVHNASGCGDLQREPKARDLWHAIYGRLSEGKPGLYGAVTARAEAQTMRLAVLYALLDGERRMIRVEHLRAGLALWRYCEQSAAYVFGERTGDPVADRALDAIAEAGQLSREQLIADVFRRNTRADVLADALQRLQAEGLIRSRSEPTRGRSRTVYEVTKETK